MQFGQRLCHSAFRFALFLVGVAVSVMFLGDDGFREMIMYPFSLAVWGMFAMTCTGVVLVFMGIRETRKNSALIDKEFEKTLCALTEFSSPFRRSLFLLSLPREHREYLKEQLNARGATFIGFDIVDAPDGWDELKPTLLTMPSDVLGALTLSLSEKPRQFLTIQIALSMHEAIHGPDDDGPVIDDEAAVKYLEMEQMAVLLEHEKHQLGNTQEEILTALQAMFRKIYRDRYGQETPPTLQERADELKQVLALL